MILKNRILQLGVCLSLVACQSVVKPARPENFISEDKMVEISMDVALLKAGRNYNTKLLNEKGILPSDYIYKNHGVDSVQFAENYKWYVSQPKKYKEIFERVKDSFVARKEVLDKKKSEGDSLKVLKGEKVPGKSKVTKNKIYNNNELKKVLQLETKKISKKS